MSCSRFQGSRRDRWNLGGDGENAHVLCAQEADPNCPRAECEFFSLTANLAASVCGIELTKDRLEEALPEQASAARSRTGAATQTGLANSTRPEAVPMTARLSR